MSFPGFSSPAAGPEAPLDMLAACHTRVEKQCRTLERLQAHLGTHGSDTAAQEAAHAVLRMRDDIDGLMATEVDPQMVVQSGTFDRLASNLGALGFLIDMLNVQPQLAKSLFRFDPEDGSFSAVMGQSERPSAFAPEVCGFGSVTVGTTSASQPVTVTNTGTASLVFGAAAVSMPPLRMFQPRARA